MYDYTDENNKRHYKSFTSNNPTAKGKREAEAMATSWALEKERRSKCALTFGEALTQYISDRESVLAVSTIREYKRTKRVDLKELEDISISDITQEQIQEFINKKAKDKSPKTVRNIHGIISSVLRVYRPNKTESRQGVIRIDGATEAALREIQAETGLPIKIIASKAIKWALERVEIEEV